MTRRSMLRPHRRFTFLSRSTAVASGGGGDTTPPTFTWASSSDGTYIEGTASEACNTSSTPATARFTKGGTTLAELGATSWFDDTHFRIALVGRLLQSETITLSYTAATNPLEDVAGNDAVDFSNAAVANNSVYEAEAVIDTLLSDWSLADTEYIIGHPARALIWGAGGGGDGGVTNGASGGAGELRDVTIAAMAAGGYSGTIGVKGAAGSAGTATAGTASTLTGPSGLIATANGGSPGNSTGPTGGAGGTGGSGGTGRNGGAGTGGTGNRSGGATSGSSTAASGSTPGEPEGNPGVNGDSNFPGQGVGGAVRTGTPLTGRDGGDGVTRLFYVRAVVATAAPYFAARGYGRTIANASTATVAVPGTHVANDRGLVQLAKDGTAGESSMTGYTELLDLGNTAVGLVYVRDLDNGPDPVTVDLTSNEQVSWQYDRIRNASAVANWALTSAAVTASTTPNPPSHNQGSSVDALWFVGCATDLGNTALGLASWPTNYRDRIFVAGGVVTSGVNLALASRVLLATQTHDPDTFTTNFAGSGRTWTLCVPKA